MGLGLDVRLSRLFSHTSGNLFGIAVDHFVGYGNVREGGLSNLPDAVARCVSAGPDTMTMTPGTAKSCWPPHVGKASLIVQASYWTPDDHIRDRLAAPRLGRALPVEVDVDVPLEADDHPVDNVVGVVIIHVPFE